MRSDYKSLKIKAIVPPLSHIIMPSEVDIKLVSNSCGEPPEMQLFYFLFLDGLQR